MLENIFADLPFNLEHEVFDNLLSQKKIRIERIVSQGHTSPKEGWYNQDENEWVIVLEGAGVIQFEDDRQMTLKKGDFIHITAHTKHKVIWTAPASRTIWLAVHYSAN